MKSRASINGHPIHPILVCFPIAFYTGALIVDILTVSGNHNFNQTAVFCLIGGLIGAAAAAIAGVIDFIFTVPPKSSARSRGAKHGIINVVVLILFAAALHFHLDTKPPDMLVILILEAIGFILLIFSGWLGGTLVYRNQIGVNPRYAGAGRWKEEHLTATNGRIEFTKAEDLGINQMCLVHAAGKRIVVARTAKGLAAFSDHCSHKGGSLAGGSMICGIVQCPWHGSQFDVETGLVKAGPAKESIIVYPLEVENGKLYIKIGMSSLL